MKSLQILSLISVALGMNGLSAPAFATSCASTFQGNLPNEVSWRSATTHVNSNQGIAPTSAAREAEISTVVAAMKAEVLGEGQFAAHGGDIPPIEFISASGVTAKYLHHTDGVSGSPTRIEISGIGASGLLEGTMLGPVSGHNGKANAIAWSTTDVSDITTSVSTDAKGTGWSPETTLVHDIKSLGIVTAQEMSVQLQKGKIVRILYYRAGTNSGGGAPGGYFEGRVIEFVWDGT